MASTHPTPHLSGRLGFLEQRRAEVERVNAMLIKPNHVAGFTEISFSVNEDEIEGSPVSQELLVDVTFPVWFVDKPSMSFGAELVRDLVEAGKYPTISVVVVRWRKEKEVRVGGGYFVGATLAIVASGRSGEQMIVHWQAEGKAVTVTGSG